MRVAEYIWHFLADKGVKDVFLVTGGNAMHLNDALGLEKRIRPICVHHEQAASMAAEGFARVDGMLGVLCVTSGPAAINALAGLYGAYVDSIPVMCIAGQSKRELLRSSRDPQDVAGLRQLGVQEADAVTMARPVTKYAATISEPFMVRYELEKAWHLATSGRPGPVFIDVPLDVQATEVDLETLPGFNPQSAKHRSITSRCSEIVARIKKAKRPLLLGGEGVREAASADEFLRLAEKLAIPVVTAWMPDLYPPDQQYYAGRMGTLGSRAGNLAVQNADIILAVGSRLSIPQVSFNWENFAQNTYVISINIDPCELAKPIYAADESVIADPGEAMRVITSLWDETGIDRASLGSWLKWCRDKVTRYPEVTDAMREFTLQGIHPYLFIEELFKRLEDDAFVACGNAASACVAFQAAPLRLGQRLTSNASAGAMGHDFPSAIGAAVARSGKRVICLAGDGSFMMNLQELQTVAHEKLPIGIIVMNNGGYFSIRNTQKNFFGRFIGESAANGVSFPDFTAVAQAFGIQAFRLEGEGFISQLESALAMAGPWLCEVILDPAKGFEPSLMSRKLPDGTMVSSRLDDMFPFLSEEEQSWNKL
jgi:acetolactate synthase-1/2/3 large subunit